LNLILDIGNTQVKAALFEHHQCMALNTYPSLSVCVADFNFIKKASRAIVSSVVKGIETDLGNLKQSIPVSLFSTSLTTPIRNLYESPDTLGADRLLASIGAFAIYPNKNVLVIDAGTCIKYNFTNLNNEFIGGAISPGLQMRFMALNQFTSQLPLIEPSNWDFPLIGKNTNQSICSGVINGSLNEIKGTIKEYENKYPELICILTGGDSDFLAKQLKNSIFVHQNLVLEGLNYTLLHQLGTI
jgi:type III pantothenate kinase